MWPVPEKADFVPEVLYFSLPSGRRELHVICGRMIHASLAHVSRYTIA